MALQGDAQQQLEELRRQFDAQAEQLRGLLANATHTEIWAVHDGGGWGGCAWTSQPPIDERERK